MQTRRVIAVAVALLSVASGCGPVPVEPDAGPPPDAGSPPGDAGGGPTADAAPLPLPPADCAANELELPVPTHWSNSARPNQYPGTEGRFEYLASDAIVTPCGELGVLCDHWPLYPTYESYLGENHSIYPMSDPEAVEAARQICALSGIPVRLLRPDALEAGRLRSRSGALQILYARVVQSDHVSPSGRPDPGALLTIFLPPDWDADAPAGSYPLLIRGGYDIQGNTFDGLGIALAAKVASTPGLIGIAWNGGSSLNGISAERRMLAQFQALVDFVANELGGDKHRIVTAGCSRQGLIQILLAGNPEPHDYTIRFASSSCAPPKGWEAADLMEGTFTMLPAAMGYIGNVVGVPEVWRRGFRYPDVGNELHGLSAADAAVRIIGNAPDIDTANETVMPFAHERVEALRDSGTPLYLEWASHDGFQPNHVHLQYLERLLAAGVPVEAHYVILGGHQTFRIFDRALAALDTLMAGGTPTVTPGLTISQRNYLTGAAEPFEPLSGGLPFTLEHGRHLYREGGGDHPFVITGPAGTSYDIEVRRADGGAVEHRISGTIPATSYRVERLRLTATSALGQHEVRATIRYPDEPGSEPPHLVHGTPVCATCTSDLIIYDVEPERSTSEQAQWEGLHTPGAILHSTSWGVADRRGGARD